MVVPILAQKNLAITPVRQQVALTRGVGKIIFFVRSGACNIGSAAVDAAGAAAGLPRAAGQMLVCNVADESAAAIWIVAAAAATVLQLEYSRPNNG